MARMSDSDGKVRFASIFPAAYAGPHIHFEVYASQLARASGTVDAGIALRLNVGV
jgi:protocatechuate 3,4-dioxygenase beta subunit